MAILITGASAGFGKAMCRRFAEAGYHVIGAARRTDKLEALQAELGERFYPLQMDVSDQASVDAALQSLPEPFAEIDALINNAGLALGLEPAGQADFADWLTMINTNIIGLTYLTRQVLPQMVARKSGYIINLGSIAGTYPYPGGNVYGASKAYVRQFSLNLRADLAGTDVRVSNIEPGLCGDTEFSNVRFKGDDARAAKLAFKLRLLGHEDCLVLLGHLVLGVLLEIAVLAGDRDRLGILGDFLGDDDLVLLALAIVARAGNQQLLFLALRIRRHERFAGIFSFSLCNGKASQSPGRKKIDASLYLIRNLHERNGRIGHSRP